MERTTTAYINGKQYTLNFGMAVAWDLAEKYDNVAGLLTAMREPGKAGFDAVRWIAVKLANNGELYRRALGYHKNEMLTEKDIQPTMAPGEFIPLTEAVIKAIENAYVREEEDPDKEYDLGLAELNEKK